MGWHRAWASQRPGACWPASPSYHPDTQETVLCWFLQGFGICQKWEHHNAVLLHTSGHTPSHELLIQEGSSRGCLWWMEFKMSVSPWPCPNRVRVFPDHLGEG